MAIELSLFLFLKTLLLKPHILQFIIFDRIDDNGQVQDYFRKIRLHVDSKPLGIPKSHFFRMQWLFPTQLPSPWILYVTTSYAWHEIAGKIQLLGILSLIEAISATVHSLTGLQRFQSFELLNNLANPWKRGWLRQPMLGNLPLPHLFFVLFNC